MKWSTSGQTTVLGSIVQAPVTPDKCKDPNVNCATGTIR
jgi:hypothetical protein